MWGKLYDTAIVPKVFVVIDQSISWPNQNLYGRWLKLRGNYPPIQTIHRGRTILKMFMILEYPVGLKSVLKCMNIGTMYFIKQFNINNFNALKRKLIGCGFGG